MKKNTIKYFIDVTIFIDFCSIAIIGLLLGLVIPEGSGKNKFFLGLHRHDWGDIHFFLSFLLFFLLVIHIWFNKAWIVNSTKQHFGDEKWKTFLWVISFGWIVVLITGWLAVKLI